MSKDSSSSWTAWGVLAVLAAAAVLIALARWLLPPILRLIYAVIHGTVAGALAGATAVGSTAAIWVFVVAGGAASLILVNRIIRQARKRPFEWLLPVLSAVSGFLASLAKELYPGTDMARVAFSSLTALLFLGAGLLWRSSRSSKVARPLTWRVLSCLFYAIPFGIVLAAGTLGSAGTSFWHQLTDAFAGSWPTLVGLCLVAVATVLLAHTTKDLVDTP